MNTKTIGEMWEILINSYGVSEETLNIITSINGYNEETMCDVLYVVSGERNFEEE